MYEIILLITTVKEIEIKKFFPHIYKFKRIYQVFQVHKCIHISVVFSA